MRISIVLSLLLLVSACKESPKNTTLEEDSSEITTLKYKLLAMEKERDCLLLLLENASANTNKWFGDMESKSFKEMGIDTPESYIRKALQNNPSVIPLDGVLGGTMFFTDIEVLGTKWIIASYEDGHILGRSIFTYKINPETMEVEFGVLDRVMDY